MSKIKLTDLYNSERISGIFLMMSFLAAVLAANIEPFREIYKSFVFYEISLGFADFFYTGALIHIVNDGLMTLFFLLIGLELKFHLVRGDFQEKNSLILPGAAAVGGIVVPALIYYFFNRNSPETLKGWAIPIATDTAFMLGILSFFSSIVSSKLRAFIIGFSLIDDAIALMILAIFYSKSASFAAVVLSLVLSGLLFFLSWRQVANSAYYLLIGICLWVAMVKAGIHGTLCGVVVALTLPVTIREQLNPYFHHLETILRPIVYFLILPLFSFINSGISLKDFEMDLIVNRLSLGIIFGLFIGKQLGVFLFSYVAVKLKYCSLPSNVSWPIYYAVAVLGGIGFTLSLFIGDLSFDSIDKNYVMRLSVVIGSVLSAVMGVCLLLMIQAYKEKGE